MGAVDRPIGANIVNDLPTTSLVLQVIGQSRRLVAMNGEAAVWVAVTGDAVGPTSSWLVHPDRRLVLLGGRGLPSWAIGYVRAAVLVAPPMLLVSAPLLAGALG